MMTIGMIVIIIITALDRLECQRFAAAAAAAAAAASTTSFTIIITAAAAAAAEAASSSSLFTGAADATDAEAIAPVHKIIKIIVY